MSTPMRVSAGRPCAIPISATPRVCETLKSMPGAASASSGRPRTPRRISTADGAIPSAWPSSIAQGRAPGDPAVAQRVRAEPLRARPLGGGQTSGQSFDLGARALESEEPRIDTGRRWRERQRLARCVELRFSGFDTWRLVLELVPGATRRESLPAHGAHPTSAQASAATAAPSPHGPSVGRLRALLESETATDAETSR